MSTHVFRAKGFKVNSAYFATKYFTRRFRNVVNRLKEINATNAIRSQLNDGRTPINKIWQGGVVQGKKLYFKKFEIYSMEWQLDINMENVVLVAAQYGGPIAVMRDKNKLQKLKGSPQTIINVFSGSGKPMIPIKWNGKRIVKMGWSNEEELICIQEDGKVVIHDVFTGEIRSLSIFQEVQVKDAIIFTNPQNFTGIAIITKGHKVYYINNIQEPTKRQLSDVMRSSSPSTSWVVISSENAQTEVLLAREKELYRLTTDEMHPSTMLEPDIKSHYTSILEMALSINSRHVVIFTNAGFLWLGSSDLRTKYAEVETGVIFKPKQLVWCGNEAVVAFWEEDHTLLVVGRHGEKMIYSYDCSVYLVPEIDGTRILSAMQHELLQKVPGVVQKIFRINSTDPGSFLLEASKQFQKRSHRADEYISLVKNDLERAVEQCIQAAGYEFEPEVQKMLIRAAQFGKCFVSDIDSDDYVRMCRILRVLNAVRDTRIGIPLTFTELECSTHQVLLDRLVARRQYYLAIQIAKYLKMSDKEGSNRILVHWAKYKVSKRQSTDDDQIAREIAEKLGYNPCISYSEIAKTASDNGRKKLAIKLLDYEPKASEQVKLLVDLAEYEPALVKAIESGDSDLIYDVILKIYATIPLGDCKLLFHKYTVCLVLYVKYCREHDVVALKEILVQEDDFNSQAQHALISSLQEEKTSERETYLAHALEAYKKCRSDLNVSICDEALRLSKFQKTLEEKLKEPFFGKSVHDTCYELLIQKQLKWAEKLKSDFKIPDKRYWWLRIQVMAEQQQWEELDKFSKLKKSPIGYAPFVDVCLQYDKEREANKYLPRVSEELKIKYYVKANKLEEAAQIAFEQRDHQGLLYVQSRCSPQSELSEKINNYVSQLGARK